MFFAGKQVVFGEKARNEFFFSFWSIKAKHQRSQQILKSELMPKKRSSEILAEKRHFFAKKFDFFQEKFDFFAKSVQI